LDSQYVIDVCSFRRHLDLAVDFRVGVEPPHQ
jgi:hypothetical protein